MLYLNVKNAITHAMVSFVILITQVRIFVENLDFVVSAINTSQKFMFVITKNGVSTVRKLLN
jgi:hypothetical protein